MLTFANVRFSNDVGISMIFVVCVYFINSNDTLNRTLLFVYI